MYFSRAARQRGHELGAADFGTMARAFLEHTRTGNPLAGRELDTTRNIVDTLVRDGSGDTARMSELAVARVLRNPNPVPLSEPRYRR